MSGMAEKKQSERASSCSLSSHSTAEHVQVMETITRRVLGLPCNKIPGEKGKE